MVKKKPDLLTCLRFCSNMPPYYLQMSGCSVMGLYINHVKGRSFLEPAECKPDMLESKRQTLFQPRQAPRSIFDLYRTSLLRKCERILKITFVRRDFKSFTKRRIHPSEDSIQK